MTARILTQAELKSQLNYDPDTGIFTRLLAKQGVKIGDVAGTNKDGYVNINVGGRLYKAHVLAWLYMSGVYPVCYIDHIDKNKSNNVILNLREATASQNGFNKTTQKNNKTGQKGVFFDKFRNKYRVEAQINGIKKYLGRFDKFNDAKNAYLDFAIKHHGIYFSN